MLCGIALISAKERKDAMTYLIEFRKKVLKLEEEGESYIKLSIRFKISTTTISRPSAKVSKFHQIGLWGVSHPSSHPF